MERLSKLRPLPGSVRGRLPVGAEMPATALVDQALMPWGEPCPSRHMTNAIT